MRSKNICPFVGGVYVFSITGVVGVFLDKMGISPLSGNRL
jgi:hypothetical protein